MRIERDNQLIFLSLAMLAEQVELARTAVPPPSHGVRLALKVLHLIGGGERAPFDAFWLQFREDRRGWSETIENYSRTTHLQTQLRGVMRAVGVEPCVATTVAVYTKRHLEVRYHNPPGETIGYRLFFYMDSYRALDAGVDWLLAHAGSGDVIAVSMPHWVYLRTGNKVVMPPFESDPLKAQQLLESVPVTYLILDEGLAIDSQRFTKGVVERFPERWRRVYSDDVTTETGERHEQVFAIYERIHPNPAVVQPERDPVTHHISQNVLTVAGHHEAR